MRVALDPTPARPSDEVERTGDRELADPLSTVAPIHKHTRDPIVGVAALRRVVLLAVVDRRQLIGRPVLSPRDRLVKVGAIEPIPSTAFPTPARRPLNSRLCCRRLEDAFHLLAPSWEEALDDTLPLLLKQEFGV